MIRKATWIFVLLVSGVAGAQPAGVRVTAPADKSVVGERPVVEGVVSDPTARVAVVVHPLQVSGYWVQPAVTPRNDGTWSVQVYVGRPGDVDAGKRFEIIAVANPAAKLKEGEVLSGWPDAQARSEVVEVTRH